MISALKKLARKNDETRPAMPSGVSSMGQSLQRKFGRGVQYNMKIVIKGDRNTGKSTLLERFQGKAFKEDYIPTNEIQVCSINWNYRVADDVVKVEVWDVVDKGKRKRSDGDGLKLANTSQTDDEVPGILDAEFLDVYKGTHGCIMIMDITKQWTFKYIQRELPKVPKHIPVLILSNFLDMQEHRVVQKDEITSFVKYFDRGQDGAVVQCGECCMKDGFGLKFIHKFFNIPFLKLQRETLEKQLETNKEDMEATLEELSFHQNSEEQDYEKFLAYIEKKSSNKKQKSTPQTIANDTKSSPSTPPKSSATSLQSLTGTKSNPGSSKKSSEQPKSIDDFVPEDTIDSGFLEENDKGTEKNAQSSSEAERDESDNDKSGNPMVSGFQDISSDDEEIVQETQPTPKQNVNTSFDVDIEITSEESEQEETSVVSPVIDSDDDYQPSNVEQKNSEAAKPVILETKYDVVLNDEDNNFMDAWLDSPSTDPREVSVKSRTKDDKSFNKSNVGIIADLEIFAASQLSSKNSSTTPAVVAENSPSDIEEEKKKRHSEKKQKEDEEGKRRHRSKHSKHKKKSRTKNSDGETEEVGEKKHKSKKKHRHKNGRSREKVEGTGAEYESF